MAYIVLHRDNRSSSSNSQKYLTDCEVDEALMGIPQLAANALTEALDIGERLTLPTLIRSIIPQKRK